MVRCNATQCTVHGAAPVLDGSGAFPGEMRRSKLGAGNVWVSSVCGASTVRLCFCCYASRRVALRCFFFYCLLSFFVFVRLVRVLWRMGARGAARRVNRGR